MHNTPPYGINISKSLISSRCFSQLDLTFATFGIYQYMSHVWKMITLATHNNFIHLKSV